MRRFNPSGKYRLVLQRVPDDQHAPRFQQQASAALSVAWRVHYSDFVADRQAVAVLEMMVDANRRTVDACDYWHGDSSEQLVSVRIRHTNAPVDYRRFERVSRDRRRRSLDDPGEPSGMVRVMVRQHNQGDAFDRRSDCFQTCLDERTAPPPSRIDESTP
jgi:hypothetical protein